jgi:hypothetical protein
MKSNSIWASKIQYLNDSREFIHGCDLAITALKASAAYAVPNAKLFVEKAEDLFGRIADINLCVCSFSEDGDVLSQWRAYAKDEQGFSIGFLGEEISLIGIRHRFTLGKCVYDGRLQDQIAKELAFSAWSDFTRLPASADDSTLEKTANVFVNEAMRVVPFMKHKGFSEEREWRLASGPIDYTLPEYKVRVGQKFPIPYYDLPLILEAGSISSLNFVIGPGVSQKAAFEALTILSKTSALKWRGSSYSQTPFRKI